MPDKKISILMSVHNGATWLPRVLDSLKNQTFPHENTEILVLDNASTDDTVGIIYNFKKNVSCQLSVVSCSENIGFWAGFEKLLPDAKGEYIIALTDVILDPHFIESAINAMESDKKAGALQAKIYQGTTDTGQLTSSNILDTCGFKVSRSRRVTNLGHGEEDKGQYDHIDEVFGVEGAVPVFRKSALVDCMMGDTGYGIHNTWLVDPDFRVGPFGYGDDLDLAWRMRLFGWKQILAPNVIAYHDRSTTKGISHGLTSYLHRVSQRQRIDIRKRRLDWSNVRFTIVKNDAIIDVLKDLPYILAREISVFGYTLFFEPAVFVEVFRFFRLLPRMLGKRHLVRTRVRTSPAEMRKWFLK